MAAALLAVLLAVALPLGGGGWRDDHLAAATLCIAVVLALLAAGRAERDHLESALRDRRFLAVLGGVALTLVLTAAQALSSPIADAARQRWVLDLAIAATFVAASLIAASGRRASAVLADGVVLGAVLLAVLSLVHGERDSLAWPFTSHAQLGALFAGAAAFAFVPSDFSAFGQPSRRALVPRELRIGACAFLAVVTAASQSRSAFLALTTGLFVVLAFRPGLSALGRASRSLRAPLGGLRPPKPRAGSRVNRRRVAALVAVLLAGALLWTRTTGRWNLLVESARGPLHERAGVFRATLSLVADAPLLGSGLGAYGSRVWAHTPPGLGGAIEHAHSLPLEVLAERGLLGALALLAVLALASREALRALRGPRSEERTLAGQATLAAGVLFLQSLVDVSLNTPSLVLLAAAAAGTAVGLAPRHGAEPVPARSSRLLALSLPAIACLVVTAGLWAWLTGPRTHATLALQAGDRAAALELSRASLVRFPSDRLSLRRLARDGSALSTRHFLALAALDPFDPFAALGAASFHESRGDLEEAEAFFRKSIALHPGGWEVRREWIAFLARRDRLAEAIEESVTLTALHPERITDLAFWAADVLDNPLMAESLAPAAQEPRRRIAQHLLGRGDGGVDAALRLLASLPRDPATSLLIARALVGKERADESRALARELSSEPGATGLAAAVLFAELAATPEDLAYGIEKLQSAVARSVPVDPAGARALLDAYGRAGRTTEADAWLDAAIERDSASSALYELRLARRWSAGAAAGAMADARRLIELSPRAPQGRLALARIYEARGSVEGARQLYTEALAVAPGNPEATAGLARLPPHQKR